MADEEKDVESGEETPKKKSPIILIVVLVVVGLALAVGISIFVTTKIMADAATENEGGDERHHEPGVFIKLGDSKDGTMLVNVGGAKSAKFLKVGIVLEMNPGKKSVINEETKTLQPDADIKIMDITTQFLRSTKVEDFDATKQDEFKKSLKDLLNSELGSGSVYDIYITSFLLQ